MVPEPTGAEVRQEVADVERRIGEAEAVKVHDKNPLSAEEQLAGLESAVGRAAGGLQHLQARRQLLSEPLRLVRMGRVLRGDQRGPLACALRRFSSRVRRSHRPGCAGVQTCQRVRREAELFTGDDHVEDPAVASPEKTRPKGADTWAQRLRSCPVRRLDRLVEHESQRLHGAERAWEDGLTGLRLLGVELLRGYLDPACLFRIAIHLAEER